MADRAHLTIGEVLTLLREDFPDVSISKIRFLESQGLVDPERTPSGYRKFYDHDVERLRWILQQQREHFLPLKVIRGRLADQGEPEGDSAAEPTDPEGSTGSARVAAEGGAAGGEVGQAEGRSALLAPAGTGEQSGRPDPGQSGEPGAGQSGEPGAGQSGEGGAGGVTRSGRAERVGESGPGHSSPADTARGLSAAPGAPTVRPSGAEPTDRGTAGSSVRSGGSGAGGSTAGGSTAGGARPGGRVASSLRVPLPPPPSPDVEQTTMPPSSSGAADHTGSGAHGREREGGTGDPGPRATGPEAGAGESGARPVSGANDNPTRPGGASPELSPQGSPGGHRGSPEPPEAGPLGTTRPVGVRIAEAAPASAPSRVPGAAAGGGRASSATPIGREGAASPEPSATPEVYTTDELAAAAGCEPELVGELQQYGLLTPNATVRGIAYFDPEALAVTRTAASFAALGVEPRHLRSWRTSADREISLFEQLAVPLLRQRNPQARKQAAEMLGQLAQLGADLRAELVREGLARIR